MIHLSRNIVANFGGQAATTVIGLVTVPLYLRFLGVEGYGLVSLLLVLQAVTAVLDFGLSTTANREVSRYIAQGSSAADRHDLVRTLEVFYFGVAAVILLALAAAAPWLATGWFTSPHFSAATIRTCLLIAGASVAARWPTALYQGILRGAEQQVVLNVVMAMSNLLRGVGSILVLIFVARSVVAFFWWQLAFSVADILICVFAARLWGDEFHGSGGRFDLGLLRRLWRFSVTVGGLSLFALVLKQLDKLIVSAMLPLGHLGYYNAASLASNGLAKVAQPVQSAVFPRLTSHHARGETAAMARTFHGAVQGVTFLTAPLAFVFMFFSSDVLWLWTQSAELTIAAAPALAVLSAAMLFNGMMSVPFSLMLASGLTWVPLAMNGVGAVLLTPLTYTLVRSHGITGAAVAWLVFNVLNYLVAPLLMFRHVLHGEYRIWLLRDTLPFVAVGLACFGAARWGGGDGSFPVRAAWVGVAAFAYAGLMVALSPMLRDTLRSLTQLGRSAP